VAYVTPIGSAPAQVEYRLTAHHGCGRPGVEQARFSYHADGSERPLVWTGRGLAEVGITPGSVLDETQFDAARALMAGLDPRTGERLVEPKLAVYDEAKVALAPLVHAVEAAAVARGVHPDGLFASVKVGRAYGRAVRAVVNDGDGAVLRADDAGRIADAVGLDVAAVWGTGVYAAAVGNLTETRAVPGPDGKSAERLVPRRRVVGNMGYDVSFTLPKSHSLLLAFADETTAAAVEQVYTAQVGATFDWLEGQTAYGMRGHHGEGKSAQTVRGSGFLGWSMVHRAARPVGDRVVGDPHWHVHVTIANMTRGSDGGWSTVAAGGRDLMRHAPAADHVLKALVRRRLAEQFGVSFARSQRTGAWEVAAIPDATLRAFSKRGASIEAMLRDLGFDPALATRRAEDLAAAQTRHDKTEHTAAPDATLRSIWQEEARTLGVDPDRLAASALPLAATRGAAAGGPPAGEDEQAEQQAELLADVVGRLTDPEHGLTSGRRRFTRVDALAAVADALPGGAGDVAEIEGLCDRALSAAGIVALPDPPGTRQTVAPAAGLERSAAQQQSEDGQVLAAAGNAARRQIGAGHMANAARFTTADVVAAERVILSAAAGSGPGQGGPRVMTSTAALARQAVEAGQGFALSGEQAAVVGRLVTSDRMIDAVLGPPGTGKTTLMRAARTAWEAEGYTVAGATTAAVAAQNLQLESGIDSRTVAQWVREIGVGDAARAALAGGTITDPELLAQAQRDAALPGLAGVDVLVLDEANLTDDRDRAALYTAAARSGTKLVEVGDPKQLRGVGCGSLFARVHQLVGGMELTENRRQASEDERAAIAAWRDGRYAHALSSWAGRGRLVATETGEQAVTAMVASWMAQRAGAPDAHAEMRGVVMLAAANDTVERLNDAAQAVRAATGELGPEHVYEVKAGRSLRLRRGDHVLVRLNDRAQRMHEGPDVLNGYRGIVEHIDTAPGSRDSNSGGDSVGGDSDCGAVRVAWQQQGPDGLVTHRATLSAEFVGAGGLSLGYAMTGHKAEGLTVAGDWALPDGTRQGGTVLVHAAGMDEPGLHVATSRHRDKVILFAGRDQLETPGDTHELGTPATDQQLERRVVAGLADQARTRSGTANDTPVHDDLGRGAGRGPGPAGGSGRHPSLEDLRRAVLGPVEERPADPPVADPADPADAWARLKGEAAAEDRPVAELRAAWTEQARAAEQLAALEPRLARARGDAARAAKAEVVLAPLRGQLQTARDAQAAAEQAAAAGEQTLAGRAEQLRAELARAWDAERPGAGDAARTVRAGAGRLGLRRGQVRVARQQLAGWAERWRPVVGELERGSDGVVGYAAAHPANDRVGGSIARYAADRVRAEAPEHAQVLASAQQARRVAEDAQAAFTRTAETALRPHPARLAAGEPDLSGQVGALGEQTQAARTRLAAATERVAALSADPTITSRSDPAAFLAAEHTAWSWRDQALRQQAAARARQAAQQQAEQDARRARARNHELNQQPGRRQGPRLGR